MIAGPWLLDVQPPEPRERSVCCSCLCHPVRVAFQGTIILISKTCLSSLTRVFAGKPNARMKSLFQNERSAVGAEANGLQWGSETC